MLDSDLRFKKMFKISVIAMRLNRSHPFIPRDIIWFLQFAVMSSINGLCLFFLIFSIICHDIKKGNYTEACKNITMTLIFLNTNIKYVVLLYYQKSIADMIRILDEDYKKACIFPIAEKSIVKKYCRESILVCKFWLVCAVAASAVFPAKAIFLTLHSYFIGEGKLFLMFDLTFPQIIEEVKYDVPVFASLFGLTILFAVYSATMYIGFDPLIPIFTLHISGQLDLLSLRIGTALSGASNVQEMKKNLKAINIQLQNIYKFVSNCQDNFRLLNDINMKATTITVPLSAFQCVEYLRIKKVNIEFFTLFFGALLHFFMPCYYNNILLEKSEKFRQAVYSCGWENYGEKSIRKIILFMLTRVSRPLGISTIFYTIGLDTFAAMCQQSYSLLNLMNAAWAK